MKRNVLFIFLILAHCMSWAENVAFLKTGGTGDGLSPANPTGSINTAYKILEDAGGGGTIVLVDKFALSANFMRAVANTLEVKITSKYNGIDYRQSNPNCALTVGTAGFRYVLNGPHTFENITFKGNTALTTTNYILFIANYNAITMGEGIVVTDFPSTVMTNSCSILGGIQQGQTGPTSTSINPSITIKTGKFILVGFNRQVTSTTYTGTAHINIQGGEIINLYGGSILAGKGGNLQLNISGGTFSGKIYAGHFTDANNRGVSNSDVSITGGDFSTCTGIIGLVNENGIANGGTSSINFCSHSDQSYISTLVSGFVTQLCNNTVTIANSTAISLLPNINSSSEIVVNNGILLTIDANTVVKTIKAVPGAKINISGTNTISSDSLILQSDVSGTATLTDNFETPTINAIVKQNVSHGRNWYLSSPISNGNTTDLNLGDSVVQYNETLKKWEKVTGNLTPGRGYIQTAVSGHGSNGTVKFSGITNSGDVNFQLTRTESGSSSGFNLVGNPYPSYLDFAKTAAANTNILPSIWFRTMDNDGNYTFSTINVAAYLEDNANPPVITVNNANTTITTYIPPMQAYWVRLNSDPSSTSYTVSNAMRTHSDNVGNTLKAPAPKTKSQPILRLQVTNGLKSDETVIYFNVNASNLLDKFDSPKMSNKSTSVPEIYTIANDEQLTINGLNPSAYNTELPIGFSTQQAGTAFCIKASQFDNFESDTQILLHDYLLNTTQDLTVSDYKFSSEALSTTSRFKLTFKTPSVATGINNEDNEYILVSARNKQIFVNGAALNGAVIEVLNTLGQKVFSSKINGTSFQANNNYLSGTYLVKISNGNKCISRKIIIN